MNEKAAAFIAKSTVKAADKEHRRKINFNIINYNHIPVSGKVKGWLSQSLLLYAGTVFF